MITVIVIIIIIIIVIIIITKPKRVGPVLHNKLMDQRSVMRSGA